MAISATCQEAIYLARLLNVLLGKSVHPVEIKCDNLGAISLVKKLVKHNRTKHVDTRYHFIREHYQNHPWQMEGQNHNIKFRLD